MPDVISELRAADPCPHEPDATTPAARAVLQRSRRVTAPRRRPRTAVAVLAATGLAAALVALAAGGGSTPDARAAVLRAAQALPSTTSGVIVFDNRTTSDADGAVLTAVHEQMRFDGSDVDSSGSVTFLREADQRLVTEPTPGVRVAAGVLYIKNDGPWRKQTMQPGSPMSLAEATRATEQGPARVRGSASRATAEALVAALTNVRAANGGYDGEIAPAALRAAYSDSDAFIVAGLTAHADQDLGPIAVHAELDGAGALAKVSFTLHTPWSHPTLASVKTVLTVDYSGLGQPQQILAPVS